MRLLQTICNKYQVLPLSVRRAVTVSLAIHLFGFFFVYGWSGIGPLVQGDALGYVELAENLASGKGFVITMSDGALVPETFRLPGLPLLIVPFILTGLGVTGFLIALTALSAVWIPVAVWYLGRSLMSGRIGVVAAWLMTVEPLIWMLSWHPITEIPFLMLALGSAVLYVRALTRPDVWSAVWAGVLAAAAVYVRPAGLALFAVAFLGVAGYFLVRRHRALFLRAFTTGAVTLALLVPWLLWMHAHTGVYALTGTGWRNVYTDYLASVRAVRDGASFSSEKSGLKAYARATWGLSGADINNPAHAHTLRDYALAEILSDPVATFKLEGLLFFTYFTHTNYYTRLSWYGFVVPNKASLSISQTLLREGTGGIPAVLRDLQKRYFIPVLERLWAIGLFLLAACGTWYHRHSPLTWLIVSVCFMGAFTATAIGLGVEGRLRVPILPLYYMLTAAGFVVLMERMRRTFSHAKR